MKKSLTVLTLFLIGFAGSATAASYTANLKYGLDFNTSVTENLGDGTTTVTITPGGTSGSLVNDTPLNGVGDQANDPNKQSFRIEASSGIAGLSFSTGISIGFHIKNVDIDTWRDGLSFNIDNNRMHVQWDGSSWMLYGGPYNNNTLFANAGHDWHHIGLTFKDDTVQIFGDGVLTHTFTTTTTPSTFMEIRGAEDERYPFNAADVYLDNIAIYDAVLTEKEFTYLSQNAMPTSFIVGESIPEPATASLSLLGLAALMMRRRRD